MLGLPKDKVEVAISIGYNVQWLIFGLDQMVIDFWSPNIAPYSKGNMNPIQFATYFGRLLDKGMQPKINHDLDHEHQNFSSFFVQLVTKNGEV